MVAVWGAMKAAGNPTSFLSDRIGREKAFTLGCLASILGLLMLVLVQEKSWVTRKTYCTKSAPVVDHIRTVHVDFPDVSPKCVLQSVSPCPSVI